MLKIKKILFSILVIFLFNNNEAFSLPENNTDNEWNWLKNNPFLVASHRNKKVRKISRQQEELNYSFLFLEYLKEQTGFKYKAFFYNNKKEKILLKELII